MTAATRTRRTVAGMDERRAKATELIRQRIEEEKAEHEKYRAAGQHEYGAFPHGAACGLQWALDMFDWAFSPEQDWMFQRGKR